MSRKLLRQTLATFASSRATYTGVHAAYLAAALENVQASRAESATVCNAEADEIFAAAELSLSQFAERDEDWKCAVGSVSDLINRASDEFPSFVSAGYLGGPLSALPGLIGTPRQSVVIRHSPDAIRSACELAQSVAVRALAGSPAGRLLITRLDFDGLGSGLGLLADVPKPLTDGVGVRTENRDRVEALRALADRVVRLHGSALTHPEDSFWTNETLRDNREAARLIVAVGLPGGITSEEVGILDQLYRNGPRAGVSVLAVVKDTAEWPHFAAKQAAVASDVHVVVDANVRVNTGSSNQDVMHDITPLTPPTADDIETLGEVARKADDLTANRNQLLPTLTSRPEPVVNAETRIIRATVGVGEDGRPLEFLIGDSDGVPLGGVIVGPAGSGKTTLLHGYIHASCWEQDPADLELYLLDLKEGVEFKEYAPRADNPAMPHVRLVGIESDPVFALTVLQRLQAENERRANLFKLASDTHGQSIPNLTVFRSVTNERLPRILLIADEFQRMLSGPTESRAWDLLELLARQGRSQGIHLLLATQSLRSVGQGYISQRNSTFNQLSLRVAFHTSRDESELVLGERNFAAATAVPQTRGAAVMTTTPGRPDLTHPFKTLYASAPDRVELRRQIALQNAPATAPLVSMGDRNPRVEDYVEAIQRLSVAPDGLLPLGVSADGESPVAAFHLKPDLSNHVLVVGRANDLDRFTNAIVLAAGRVPSNLPISIIDARGRLDSTSFPSSVTCSTELETSLMEYTGTGPRLLFVAGLAEASLTDGWDKIRAQLLDIAKSGHRNRTHLCLLWERPEGLSRELGSELLGHTSLRVALGLSRDQSFDALGVRAPFEVPKKYGWVIDPRVSTEPVLVDPFKEGAA